MEIILKILGNGAKRCSRPGTTFFTHDDKGGAGFDTIFLFLEEKNSVKPPKRDRLFGRAQIRFRLAFWDRE